MAQFLFKVTDVFQIKDRGCVVAPGIPAEMSVIVRTGDDIEIHCQDGRILSTTIQEIERLSPRPIKSIGFAILLPESIRKDDVPIGSEVWWLTQRTPEDLERERKEWKDKQLTRYILNRYEHLMTDFERRVGIAIDGREVAEHQKDPTLAEKTRRGWGRVGEPAIDGALRDGNDTFRQRVRDRLLAEFPDQIDLKRFKP
jgi:hypothetical protein